ncbi:pirin family protein [Marinicellulosiphila megalodicopiae]|uniref:pirin family protein n=1 Tax=Marinicellulosiphila megalodicopiae TaxID=2724896 RepID=UPI003BB17196
MKKQILNIQKLDFQWPALDPFLFCVHHLDHYPKGNGKLGPVDDLNGRQIGQDFVLKDGWRMYHGSKVPGFPAHPHRGFETITVATQGLIDHSDSMGAAGRYGDGDTQWMTAGKGVQHGEMFPLLSEQQGNDAELFQIWINLPSHNKMCEPDFKMFWNENKTVVNEKDDNQNDIKVTVINGRYKKAKGETAPNMSWAHDENNHVGVWLVELSADANWALPNAATQTNRMLYFYEGDSIDIGSTTVASGHAIKLDPVGNVSVKNGAKTAKFLLLQGDPINEPVAQYGPFVMNTQAEIQQAFADYRDTEFGGWPWPEIEQTHGDRARFAKYSDGTEEIPG